MGLNEDSTVERELRVEREPKDSLKIKF